MGSYQTVIVGTDGSESSLRAVDRAGAIAGGDGAKLIIASAYQPVHEDTRAEDTLRDEGYKLVGAAPIYDILHEARDRAKAAGAYDIEVRAIKAAPVDALVDLTREANADLLVVGNLGMNSTVGRLIGSVPSTVSDRVKCDVMIVHTTP